MLNLLKKALFGIIIAFSLIWLVISIYFYYQHNVIVWHYPVNQQIELKDAKVHISEISVRNYRRDETYRINENLLWVIIQKLPHRIQGSFAKVCYFYSKPYIISEKFGVISVKGYILNDFPTEENNIRIVVVDDIGFHYSRSGWLRESENPIVEFETKGDYYPLEKLGSPLKILVRDNRDKDHPIEITVNPTFTRQSYGLFDRKP